MGTPSFIFKRPKGDSFLILAGCLFIGFSIFISFKIFTIDNSKMVGLVLPFVFTTMGLVLIRVCLIRQQYYKLDKNKAIYLDKKRRQIQIDNNGNFSTISSFDIKDIEVFDSWNTNPLFSTLGYIKLNLQNGNSFIITKFTATELDLQSLLAGHKVKKTKKLLNAL